MGLPCFHKINARQLNPGTIQLSDINPHGYYQRKEGEKLSIERRILLEPMTMKGKGRPKGTTNKPLPKTEGYGESSSRRDPSLHEHEALKLPTN
ncbi:hypothetical protein GcM3_169019 [Golovinomyces cichoracearum]|uniref:Uncharacterized protein n=1 Tax=Golovinomyces cichoracearum TaxID=62708 RepID=A0A420HRM6_9PEZI|nr:hypothetical protein GcM3_169019 [Golovinomyces cichoracearum]